MKTLRTPALLTALLGLLVSSGMAQTSNTNPAPLIVDPNTPDAPPVVPPVTRTVIPPATPPAEPVDPAAPQATPVPPPPVISPAPSTSLQTLGDQTWGQLRDNTFEQRARFITGYRQLEGRLDRAIIELKSKRLAYEGDPDTWDAEMKRLNDARSYLNSMFTELTQATAANWEARKDIVLAAWERMVEAYERAQAMAPATS